MKDSLHFGHEELTVYYDGETRVLLNKSLLDRQNCWENLDEIKETHWLKLLMYSMLRETSFDVKLMKSLAKDLVEIEYHLQSLWKFPLDSKFHRFWEYPKCACPKLDNYDAYPYMQYTNLSCMLHGTR